MRYLITGCPGFVGSHLVDYILAECPDVEVFGLKRWWEPLDNIRQALDRIQLVDGDLTDLASLLTALERVQPDTIFHLAAQSQVDFSYLAPSQTMETNGIGTINLLEAVRRVVPGATVVVCSSPEVYGDAPPGTPITEDFPLRPVSPYALSKCAEDRAAFMYHEAYGLKTIISRGFAHEGPRRPEAFAVSNFAKQIVSIEKGLTPAIVFVGNLEATRTYCDVRDMVRAYWLLAEKGEPGKVYNICGAETMMIGSVLNLLLRMTSKRGRIGVRKDSRRYRPHDVNWQVGDDSRFRRLTLWKPQMPFVQTLQDMLAWWRTELAR